MDRHQAVSRSYLIPGMMWPQELCWLYDTFSRSSSHVEVGSFCGRSLYASTMGMRPGSTVVAIEPFLGLGDAVPSVSWWRSVFISTLREIERHEIHMRLIEQANPDAATLLGSDRFETIFIDGSHEYADVLNDIESMLPLLLPGGIIAGHDYSPAHPGVQDAVNELLPKFSVEPGTRIWRWIKP